MGVNLLEAAVGDVGAGVEYSAAVLWLGEGVRRSEVRFPSRCGAVRTAAASYSSCVTSQVASCSRAPGRFLLDAETLFSVMRLNARVSEGVQ